MAAAFSRTTSAQSLLCEVHTMKNLSEMSKTEMMQLVKEG